MTVGAHACLANARAPFFNLITSVKSNEETEKQTKKERERMQVLSLFLFPFQLYHGTVHYEVLRLKKATKATFLFVCLSACLYYVFL